MIRMHPERWTEIITHWLPAERRRLRGRHKKRWRDDLKHFSNNWLTKATNSIQFKNFIASHVVKQSAMAALKEAFAQWWVKIG